MALTELWKTDEEVWTALGRGTRYTEAYRGPTTSFNSDVDAKFSKNSLHPNESGPFGSRLRRRHKIRNYKALLSKVIFTWEPPTLPTVLEENPNKAVLWTEPVEEQEKLVVPAETGGNLYDVPVGEPFYHAALNEVRRFVVIKGSELRLKARIMNVVLYTATNQLTLATIMNLVGKVNNATLPNLGGAQPRTMLFRAPRTEYKFMDSGLWLMKIPLTWNPKGWDKASAVDLEKLVMRRNRAKDKDDEDTGPALTIKHWESLRASAVDILKPAIEETSFSVINAMVTW